MNVESGSLKSSTAMRALVTIDRFRNVPPCRVVVLSNPTAGSGRGKEQLASLARMLDQSPLAWADVKSKDQLCQEIRTCGRQGHQLVIVAAGGDGTLSLASSTLSEFADSLRGEAAVLPMPLGTENLLARHFGHTAEAAAVMQTIRCGASYLIDAGDANGCSFLIMATCGFDAEVVRRMSLARRGNIYRYSYSLPIMQAIRGYAFPPLELRIDGAESIECRWAMIFNLPKYGGGLRIEPEAIDNDGELDVIAFTRGSVFSGMRYVAGIWLGRHARYPDVVRRRGRVVEVSSRGAVPFQLDGDYAGQLPVRVEVQPSSVRLILPAAKPPTAS